MPIKWQLIEAGFCRHPEWLTKRDGRLQPCEFPAVVALLEHPVHGRILFDTGYSEHFLNATASLPEALYRWVTPVTYVPQNSVAAQLVTKGLATNDIAHVILSHFHGDHVGGLRDFTQASIHCSAQGWSDLQSHSRIGGLRLGLLPSLLPPDFAARTQSFEAAPRCELPEELSSLGHGYDLFRDGSVIAIELPGHAAGHFGIYFIDAQGRKIFLLGDAAWSSDAIERNVPPPSIVSSWLGDTEIYRNTLSLLHRVSRESPTILLIPAHCPRWRPDKAC